MDIFAGRTILVTGGTGSFGSAFVRKLSQNKNTDIVVIARDWHKLNNLKKELPEISYNICDIRDKERLSQIISKYQVDFLVHAGAIKDVTFCEDNPTECLKTNVIGTQNVIDVCIDKKVNKAILISTDKAVQPINTYGTSKKMSEKLWINANQDSFTRFSVCRYGNVIGSAGSVLPLYKNLISQGVSKLPITDERCTRFWYPMKDAINFVINSFKEMQGGEMFIPKIPSIRIIDLVKAFNMDWEYIGLRSGEKIHEYMIAPSDVDNSEGYSSFNNPHFLTVEEIRKGIKDANI